MSTFEILKSYQETTKTAQNQIVQSNPQKFRHLGIQEHRKAIKMEVFQKSRI